MGMTRYSINCARMTGYPCMRKNKIRFLPQTKISPGRWGRLKNLNVKKNKNKKTQKTKKTTKKKEKHTQKSLSLSVEKENTEV